MSQVHLIAAAATDSPQLLDEKLHRLWVAARFDALFTRHDLTAIKVHVGEPGTRTFISPAVVAPLVRCVIAAGATPFLTDTAVLYRSPRDNGVSHARVAHDHGFTIEAVGAPFIPADGLIGADEIEVRVDGTHFETVAMASGILQARSVLVLSHATGHLGTGLAATLKNLGMGCASRKGKLRQHHGQQPHISEDRCTACGTCAQWCPSDAITVDSAAHIDGEICIGCGECIAICRDTAVEFGWGIMGRELQERVVDHAAAVVREKKGKIGFVTSVMQVTKDCDCLGLDQKPLLDDIGLLASTDPVAIDQAALDLVARQAGKSLESMSYPRHDASVQLAAAERMGLGSRSYELVEL
ncbi:MAG: DUF362 domain-containing protein [Pseudomonadota bacterium]